MRFKSFVIKQEIQQVARLLARLASFPRFTEAKAHSVTERYWTSPDSPLRAFLARNNIAFPNTVPQFAEGGVGRVYFVGQYAVKFTNNRIEANVASMVKGKPDLPTAVLDVAYMDNGIYAILQPYINMSAVPAELKKAADYLTAAIDDTPDAKLPESPAAQKKLCRETLAKHGGDLSLLPHMLSLIMVLNNLYHATGFRHDDAGPTNVAMHQGKIVIPDLGPNQTADFDQLSALSQISKNRTALGLPKHTSF